MKNLKTLLLLAFLSIGIAFSASAQKSSTKIKMDELPEAAHTLIHGKYAKYNVNGMFRKQNTKGVVTYQVELQKKSNVVDLIYTTEGVLLETRKSKEYSFDGTEKPVKSSGGGGDGHSGHSH